ncbi:hypothetical protein TNCV_4287431 [Trichonephila clavipes]|uniref:Uncharacterized protein n=1 Tax=Trichonephila clavipes TaxID=2585209 RepID=A0A8X6V7J9_TRICX|nr:hypothetical protein TNCV_4287431 [Trichonephila clavipes]
MDSLGHQSLPSTNLDRLDEEEASTGRGHYNCRASCINSYYYHDFHLLDMVNDPIFVLMLPAITPLNVSVEFGYTL